MGWTNVLPGSGLYPDLMLEWAPTTRPTDEVQTWVDITDRLRGFEWGYGRNDELAEFEAGTGYVILDNRDRAFDPSYAAGPWFGNIQPRRMFRLQARWNGVIEGVFVAHARSFPQAYPGGGTDKQVRISLADDLAILRAVDLDALGFNRPAERSDNRLTAVLDEAGIPASRQDVQVGAVTVAATADQVGDTGSALTHAKAVAEDSEGWPIYVARIGKVTMI